MSQNTDQNTNRDTNQNTKYKVKGFFKTLIISFLGMMLFSIIVYAVMVLILMAV